MIIVHEIFVCKPGQASKLAKMFKDAKITGSDNVSIMTDVTGQYNRVIMASWYKDMADYVKSYERYMNPDAEMKDEMKKMEGYHDMYLWGKREIYRTW